MKPVYTEGSVCTERTNYFALLNSRIFNAEADFFSSQGSVHQ